MYIAVLLTFENATDFVVAAVVVVVASWSVVPAAVQPVAAVAVAADVVEPAAVGVASVVASGNVNYISQCIPIVSNVDFFQ